MSGLRRAIPMLATTLILLVACLIGEAASSPAAQIASATVGLLAAAALIWLIVRD